VFDHFADARRGCALTAVDAMKALVMAMVILAGSKPTTLPLRRMTLYSAKRGSLAMAGWCVEVLAGGYAGFDIESGLLHRSGSPVNVRSSFSKK